MEPWRRWALFACASLPVTLASASWCPNCLRGGGHSCGPPLARPFLQPFSSCFHSQEQSRWEMPAGLNVFMPEASWFCSLSGGAHWLPIMEVRFSHHVERILWPEDWEQLRTGCELHRLFWQTENSLQIVARTTWRLFFNWRPQFRMDLQNELRWCSSQDCVITAVLYLYQVQVCELK